MCKGKIINNIPLSTKEKILLGRDHPVKNIDGYELKSDCAYRAISKELYDMYLETGFIFGTGQDDEYIEYEENNQFFNNNKGVDWYLGGVCLRYGNVIIECPASKDYFVPARDFGCHLSADPSVRHLKSSGYKHPVPISIIKLIKHPTILDAIDEVKITKKHK